MGGADGKGGRGEAALEEEGVKVGCPRGGFAGSTTTVPQ